jgi:pseudaminic acid synthase
MQGKPMIIQNHDVRKRVFIIAELSANHKQRMEIAVETIKAARRAGADAVKLQTYTADTMTLDCQEDYFKIKHGTIWDGRTLYDLYQEAYTPWEWQPELKKVAEGEGLICFSSAFDKSSVDFLEKMDVPAYKIASFEIMDIPLIEYVSSKQKPVILSTGIASLDDVKEAVQTCRRMGNSDIALLKCTSSYPAPIEDSNLLSIQFLQDTFHVIPGLSDHTIGNDAAIAAVAIGARIIEKHIILDRKMGGPDAAFSIEPEEFKRMVDSIRNIENALGDPVYRMPKSAVKNRVFARSLFVARDVIAGETISEANVRSIRPGYGLHPRYMMEIIGKRFKRDFKKGTPLEWGFFE